MVSSLFLFVLFTVLSLTTGGIRSMKVPRGAIVFLIFDGLCAALYNYSAVQAYANLSIGVVSTIIYCNLFCFDLYLSFNFSKIPLPNKGSRRCHRPVRRDAGGRRISFGERQWDYSQGIILGLPKYAGMDGIDYHRKTGNEPRRYSPTHLVLMKDYFLW